MWERSETSDHGKRGSGAAGPQPSAPAGALRGTAHTWVRWIIWGDCSAHLLSSPLLSLLSLLWLLRAGSAQPRSLRPVGSEGLAGALPIFLWLHELMDLSQGISCPWLRRPREAAGALLLFQSRMGRAWHHQARQADPLPGNLAAARPCVAAARATFPGLGCTGPSPWILMETGDGK